MSSVMDAVCLASVLGPLIGLSTLAVYRFLMRVGRGGVRITVYAPAPKEKRHEW